MDIQVNIDGNTKSPNVNFIKESYSKEEVAKLCSFINIVKSDESRSMLACWGNHSDYSKGY